MLDRLTEVFVPLAEFLLGYQFAYSPIFLLTSIMIAAVYWLFTRPGRPLVGYLFPRELYAHRSSQVDLALTTFNAFFIGLGGLSFIVFAPAVATMVLVLLADPSAVERYSDMTLPFALALLAMLVLAEDFCRYLIHFLHHKLAWLWPFHAVHHSAEVLTPLTFYRAHPFYFVLQQCLIAFATGLAQGLFVALAFGFAPAWVFVASAIVTRTYMLLGVHLRHSHIPMRYGRVLEHVVISPRQHQVHHSVEARHHDRNFGEIFAIWDWVFGTLYIPRRGESFEFGLTDPDGAKVQPYPTLARALLLPFVQSAAILSRQADASGGNRTTANDSAERA